MFPLSSGDNVGGKTEISEFFFRCTVDYPLSSVLIPKISTPHLLPFGTDDIYGLCQHFNFFAET